MTKRQVNNPPFVMRGFTAVNCGQGVQTNSDMEIHDGAFINTPNAISAKDGAKVKVRNVLHTTPKDKGT